MPWAPSLELLKRGNHGCGGGGLLHQPIPFQRSRKVSHAALLRRSSEKRSESGCYVEASGFLKLWEQKQCWNQGKNENPGAEAPPWPSWRARNVEFTGVWSRKLERGQDVFFIRFRWELGCSRPLNGHFILFEMNHKPQSFFAESWI